MNFKGHARRLKSVDISLLAHTIGCGEDHLHAVMEVETRGGGFDTHGRVKMLFEPHVFYRELSGSDREVAVSKGLAYRRWGERRYPSDSYPRLHAAMKIDTDAALRSCSWGLGQIMGFNHKLAGYDSAHSMVVAFLDDEDTHLAGMVEFIISSGLDDELRREDWRGFARGYNGSGYAKHGYHTKLKRAFDKWKRIPDTPFTPGNIDRSPPVSNPPDNPVRVTRGRPLRKGMRGRDVGTLQDLLAGLGYPVGKRDEIFGRSVHNAVTAFQSDHDLVADGIVGELTWEAFDTARPAPARDHDVESLRLVGSGTIEDADKIERRSKQAGTGLGLTGLTDLAFTGADQIQSAETALGGLQQLLLDKWPILLMLGVAAGLYFYGPKLAEAIRTRRVWDAVTGRNMGR